jgi:hypothetical protein
LLNNDVVNGLSLSAVGLKWAWQGLVSDQVLRTSMTGFPAHPPVFVEIETTAITAFARR